MSRETKFGYGFLVAGIGMAYLLDKAFGPLAAIVVASFCVVIGIALLVSGHRHQDSRTQRRAMATIWYFTFIGTVIGALTGALSGITWTLVQRRQTDQSTVLTNTEPAKANKEAGPAKQTEDNSAITFQPTKEFTLSSGEWSRSTPISLTNNQERSVYGLFMKIWTTTPGVLAREISVKPEKTNNPFSLPFGPTSISADVLIFDWLDAENHQSVLIRFYELKPHETRRFIVSGKTKIKSTASVRFMRFDEQPPGLLEKEGQAAFEFVPPENGKLLGLHVEIGDRP